MSVGEPASASRKIASSPESWAVMSSRYLALKPISIRVVVVTDGHFFRGAAGIGVVDRQEQLAIGKGELHGAAAFRGNRRDAVDGLGEALAIDAHFLVVRRRDDALVVRESAVDQLRGHDDGADRQADLGIGHFDA